jgi:hypothetical protein
MIPWITVIKSTYAHLISVPSSYYTIGLALAEMVIIAVFTCLGVLVNPFYFLGLLILVPLTGLILWSRRHFTHIRQLGQLRSDWGKEIKRDRDLSEIALFNTFSSDDSPGCNSMSIDDQTWADLNMDEVYSVLDRTLTTPGQCTLYQMLRTPLLSIEPLAHRNQIINLFQQDAVLRENIRFALLRLGIQKGNSITYLLWNPEAPLGCTRLLYLVLALLALGGAVTSLFLWDWSTLLTIILPIYLLNVLATYRVRAKLDFQIEAIRYLGALVRSGEQILSIGCPELADIQSKLREVVHVAKSITYQTRFLKPENVCSSNFGFLISAHVIVYFVHDVRMYYSVLSKIHKHNESLKVLFKLVGELDALQAVASYRTGVLKYVEPIFSDGEPHLEATDLSHPLIAEPVPNSISLKAKGLCVTGSNMAGKTTFIRTLGLNALLAQTVYTCIAKSYQASLFRIISSINEKDDLVAGKSYYLVEAEQLLRMVKLSEEDQTLLCLVDEPLGGTNSNERLAASLSITRYMANQGALVAITTHDLQLARKLNDVLDCYHFSDSVDHRGMHFDYQLRQGIASSSNAIKLLEYLEYPEEITVNAQLIEKG